MGRNTCAVSLKGLFTEHKEDTQTVSKQTLTSLFRFDTRRNNSQDEDRHWQEPSEAVV